VGNLLGYVAVGIIFVVDFFAFKSLINEISNTLEPNQIVNSRYGPCQIIDGPFPAYRVLVNGNCGSIVLPAEEFKQ